MLSLLMKRTSANKGLIHHARNIPRHALHEKSLQRQLADRTLVSSQEEKAFLVPLINRGASVDELFSGTVINWLSAASFVPQSH